MWHLQAGGEIQGMWHLQAGGEYTGHVEPTGWRRNTGLVAPTGWRRNTGHVAPTGWRKNTGSMWLWKSQLTVCRWKNSTELQAMECEDFDRTQLEQNGDQ